MPLQNRVRPTGEIVATAERGTVMGNRGGCLHDGARNLTRRRWASSAWICCSLEFKGRHRQVMTPRRYTELFFLDEATALAAGHRPCGECRREDFLRFASSWNETRGLAGRAMAEEMDIVLHRERLVSAGREVLWHSNITALPDGVMVLYGRNPFLVWNGKLLQWSFAGYRSAGISASTGSKPQKDLVVITPRSAMKILAAGYRPQVHASAAAA